MNMTFIDSLRVQYRILDGAGDVVSLFNGRDGEWSSRIDGAGRGWCGSFPPCCAARVTSISS